MLVVSAPDDSSEQFSHHLRKMNERQDTIFIMLLFHVILIYIALEMSHDSFKPKYIETLIIFKGRKLMCNGADDIKLNNTNVLK